MNRNIFTQKKGVTLIELLVALVISSILVAALYRTFIDQQKTYTVQDQVAEMQQSVRVGIDQMTREIRMAGYGLKETILASFPEAANVSNINNFSYIITPGNNDNTITVISAVEVAKLTANVAQGAITINVSYAGGFDNDKKKYLCLNGENNYLVQGISSNTITLTTPLSEGHLVDEPVFLLKAVTYKLDTNKLILVKNDNIGDVDQPIADNIEDLDFTYRDANGVSTLIPQDIRIVRMTLKARTERQDPDLNNGDGYRRRELTSMIKVRNLGL